MTLKKEHIGLLAGGVSVLILVGFIAAGQHGATAHQMGMRVMHKGVAGFGNLQFNGATGDYQKAATSLVGSGTGETSPSTNDASTPYSVNTYKYTGKDISIPSGNDDIYRFDTTLDSGTLSAFSHVLNTSGDYRPDSFAMVSSDGASRISYSPATGMVDYSQSSGNLATFDVGSLSASPSENPVSHEQALSTAKAFVKEFSISTTGYDAPIVSEPYGGNGLQTMVVYPLTINNLPVYDQSGQEFGITLSIGADNKVQYAHYPRSLNLVTASYPRVASFQNLLDYLGTYYGNRMIGMPVDDGSGVISKQSVVELPTATPAYTVSMSYAKTGTISQYIVPAFSFEIPQSAQASTYVKRIVLTTIKSFYDTAKGGGIVPMMESGSASGGVAK